MKAARGASQASTGREPPGRTSAASGTADARLLALLKAWRLEQSRTQRVPPYIVLNDATLQALALEQPESLAALAQVHGIGERRLETYGEALLILIAEFRRDNR